MTGELNLLKQHACFNGTLSFYSHLSASCGGPMNFSVYVPHFTNTDSLPVLYFLSGLTCTEENFMMKAGAQRYAAEQGLMLVVPDTSPRNTGIPGEEQDWDLGSGAGFYVDATEEPWSDRYQMYSYVVHELPDLIATHFNGDPARQGICGHSMGGHGALVCGLRNRDRYRSISAFAPIAAPSQCPWGQKVFHHYLGEDRSLWGAYDATELVLTLSEDRRPILIDQGMADSFLTEQLRPELLVNACHQVNRPLIYREQPQYDHSYYFISTFIEDHIRFHASHLSP
jgi:S-formylglutathione hydrolase